MLARVCPQAKEQASEWIDGTSFACQGLAGGGIRHFSGLSAQEEFELGALRWISRRGGAASGENVSDSVGHRVEVGRRDAEKELGNNQEFLAQNFQLQFCPKNVAAK